MDRPKFEPEISWSVTEMNMVATTLGFDLYIIISDVLTYAAEMEIAYIPIQIGACGVQRAQ